MNPAGSVLTNKHWTVGPAQYFAAKDYRRLAIQSRYCARDMEVDTWTRNGIVFVRKTDDGRAIYFFHNGEVAPAGYLEIGIVANLSEGVGFRYDPNGGRFHTLHQGPVTAPGYTRSETTGHRFTFGVEGFDIYARFNGVEFVRFQDYRHMTIGRVALQANVGYGFRDVTVRTMAARTLFSDYGKGVLDLRDFGLREVRALGTIREGSTTLTLGQPGEFKVGDYVIIEVGREAGDGRRGTRGVGGSWPAKSYPRVEGMRGDRSQPNGLYAWVEDAGDVYRWIDGTWQRESGRHGYYVAQAIPLALQARVVAVSGRALTLDRPAATTATDATVYFDNAHVFNKLTRDPHADGEPNYPEAKFGPPGAPEYDFSRVTPPNVTLRLPAGAFAVGRTLALVNHEGWAIGGQGASVTRIFSPKGTPSAMLVASRSPRTRVRALTLQGNARDQGYTLQTSPNWQRVTETEMEQGSTYPSGVLFASGSHDSRAEDLVVIDVFQHAVGASFSNDVWAFRVRNLMTDGLRAYVQWQFQWADAIGGGCVDCSVTSPYLIAGFEAFKSRDVQFIRAVGRNASFAMNAAGGFVIDSARLTVEPMSQHPDRMFSEDNPLVNINANIDANHPYLVRGGTIRDVTMVLDYINAQNDVLRGIVINARNPGIRVFGGVYQAPDYKPPSRLSGPTGVLSTGAGTLVDGIRVMGTVNEAHYPGVNIYVEQGSIRNCVADTIGVRPNVTVERCRFSRLLTN